MKIIVCSLCALFFAVSSPVTWADPPTEISADRIGIDVVLIGESGLPLGTEFSAEGMLVVEKAKHHKEGDSKYVLIRKLNGKLLKTPKKIGLSEDSDLEEGEWTEIMAIETAYYYLAFTPNLSSEAARNEKGRQRMNTGLRIWKAEVGDEQSVADAESKKEDKTKAKPESDDRSQ